MKMVTKTFYKCRYAMKHQITKLVQSELARGLIFDFDGDVCRLNGRNIALSCKTADALYAAWLRNNPITFSVTLPAKYWKQK